MWKDPIVEEVREARAKIAKKCDYDMHKLFKMLKEHEKRNPERIVTMKDLEKEEVLIKK